MSRGGHALLTNDVSEFVMSRFALKLWLTGCFVVFIVITAVNLIGLSFLGRRYITAADDVVYCFVFLQIGSGIVGLAIFARLASTQR
jgi:hypothetical protein